MKQTFYSYGKLLLTGEYVVLDGAKAFALPTKKGQNLIVSPNAPSEIKWKSFDFDESIWFETGFSVEEIINFKSSEIDNVKNTLIRILHEAHLLNPNFLSENSGFEVETHLSFPRNWGLGTSSTLINNIAQWFKVNAFDLLKNSFGGSGYDIACAQNKTAILYQIIDKKPTVIGFDFSPNFSSNLYFLYLNKKQSSKAAINSYYKNTKNNLDSYLKKIDQLTEKAIYAESTSQFAKIMAEHESIMSNLLELETVQEKLFPDFTGVIKSLGAWGGDFVMVIAKENPSNYFKSKGFETLLTYDEMIL